jgi:predicted dienelactone hydrolase
VGRVGFFRTHDKIAAELTEACSFATQDGMSRCRMLFVICVLLSISPPLWAASYHVGVARIAKPVVGRIWYPVEKRHAEQVLRGSPIFRARHGVPNGPIVSKPAKFPLLLLSHGSGAMVERLDWVAEYFARRGWIVAGINHPGNTWGDNSGAGLIKVWRRAEHLSEFLTHLLETSPFAARIDQTRIAALGHSAGGTTVLLLAGARFSKERFQDPIPFCRPLPAEFDDEQCGEVKTFPYRRLRRRDVEGDYGDPRIRAVVAIDPAFARSFAVDAGGASTVPHLLILADHLKDPATHEIYAKELPIHFPRAAVMTPRHSIHISFVSECSTRGLKQQLPICHGDAGHRVKIHRAASQHALKFLRGVFR